MASTVKPDFVEGITYFDHRDNVGFPNKWHVRDDGWMGVSVCRDRPMLLRRSEPKTWRYLLHAHRGPLDERRAEQIADRFAGQKPLSIVARPRPHRAYAIMRG